MNITRDMDEILPGGIRVGKEEEEEVVGKREIWWLRIERWRGEKCKVVGRWGPSLRKREKGGQKARLVAFYAAFSVFFLPSICMMGLSALNTATGLFLTPFLIIIFQFFLLFFYHYLHYPINIHKKSTLYLDIILL